MEFLLSTAGLTTHKLKAVWKRPMISSNSDYALARLRTTLQNGYGSFL